MQYNRISIYTINIIQQRKTTQVNLQKKMWQYLNAIHAIKVVSPHLLAFFLLPAKEKNNSSFITYKKMWYPLKNSQAVKQGVALCKMASMKIVLKYRWRPRNGCDVRSVTNILITTIRVNFVRFLVKLGWGMGWGNTDSPELSLLKFLSLTYHHSHFLATTCISQLFSC